MGAWETGSFLNGIIERKRGDAMQLSVLIAFVDDTKPNQYDDEVKTQWITEVESMVVEEILNKAEGNDIEFTGYDYNVDNERELLVPDKFADVYVNYLHSKIDYHNAEYARYNNSVAMFEAAFSTFAAYYRRNHMPKQPVMMSPA